MVEVLSGNLVELSRGIERAYSAGLWAVYGDADSCFGVGDYCCTVMYDTASVGGVCGIEVCTNRAGSDEDRQIDIDLLEVWFDGFVDGVACVERMRIEKGE